MSEEEAIYQGISLKNLTNAVSTEAGWNLVKQAVHSAAARMVERQECSVWTAMGIIEQYHTNNGLARMVGENDCLPESKI